MMAADIERLKRTMSQGTDEERIAKKGVDYLLMEDVTVAQAFEMAISAERAAERLYQGLAAKFAHREDVAAFWRQFVSDEATHAELLEGIRAQLPAEQLSEPADPHAVELFQIVVALSVETELLRVENMQDAYELASEMENGETNAIFRFLVDNFEMNRQVRHFLHAQLDKHLGRLSIDLPAPYRGALSRELIRAME
jgi:rubrerythrin